MICKLPAYSSLLFSEDGRFLVHPKRYDTLAKDHTKEEIDNWKVGGKDQKSVA